jgi:hypothetical protein
MKLPYKLLLFLLPFVIIIGTNIYFHQTSKEIQKIENSSICFVGSSRVKNGIDPTLLNQNNSKVKAYNFGVNGSTFYHNIIFSKYLIKNFNPKELFIELSPINYKIHIIHLDYNIDIISLDYNIDIISLINLLAPLTDNIKTAEDFLFRKLSLRNSMRNLIYQDSIKDDIGYNYINENNYFTSESFLTIGDLYKKQNIDISAHINLIIDLKALAKKHDTKIRFFLPLTFNKIEEREIVSAVFQSLSKEDKVEYTNEFLTKISNSENLKDKNHLNSKGAKIMTTYFKKNYFTK